jgi:hypothetical protein
VDHVRRVGARPGRPRTLLICLLAGLLLVPAPSTVSAAAPDRPAKLPKIGFRMGHWQLQPVAWEHLRLNGGKPMLVKTEGPSDDLGIPTRPLGERKSMVYNPTVLAQQGLKRLDSWQQTGATVHLRYARKIRAKLDELAVVNRHRRWQPHEYERGGHSVGWVNANSHGLVLSFMSRYHRLTGSARSLESARLLMAAFRQRKDDRLWFTTVTPSGHVWFEHWPSGRFVHTLNGHINALFGLYDYWAQTGSKAARRYFEGGAQTVRAKLSKFRRKGLLSRYSLSGKSGSLHYHHTHIHQLRILALMTGDDWFSRQATAFKRDERAWRRNGRPD